MQAVENLVEVSYQDYVATVTLNRPEARNAMNSGMFRRLHEIFACEIPGKKDVRAVIFQGANGYFCAGADIPEFPSLRDNDQASEYWQLFNNTAAAINSDRCPPVIAKIERYAFGAGCLLAIACDIRIAEERVRMGIPANKLGIAPGVYADKLLTEVVGKAWAGYMLYTGLNVPASEALRIGLVHEVIPEKKLLEHTNWLANVIAEGAPLTVKANKRNLNTIASNPGLIGIEEKDIPKDWSGTEDLDEGVNAFLQKRPPVFIGR